MPNPIIYDAVEIPQDSPVVKEALIQAFERAFLNTKLVKRVGRTYQQVPAHGDTLRTKGYFITKNKLMELVSHISEDEGGVWINFGLGKTRSPQLGLEIQLVITATDSMDRLADNNLGTYCITTDDSGDTTDPPYTGITS